MPIFMDRHDLPGVTAKQVAEAHQHDLEIEDQYGCRGLTYWFDEKRGTAFCLIEAPGKKNVQDMHNAAHGLVPNHLIEVDEDIVKSFLGRIDDPLSLPSASGDGSNAITDSPIRTIMITDFRDAAVMPLKLGWQKAQSIFALYNSVVQNAISRHHGRDVFHLERRLASFASLSNAVQAAIEIQEKIKEHNSRSQNPILLHIGLCTGAPVTENHNLFGQALQLARRLCFVSSAGGIASSGAGDEYPGLVISDMGGKEPVRVLNMREENFLNTLFDIIEENWTDAQFSLTRLCRLAGLSKAQLYRKTVSLTGASPADLIKEIRLHNSLKQIRDRGASISEVAYQSGFTSPSYFSTCFRKRFGMLPSDCASALSTSIDPVE